MLDLILIYVIMRKTVRNNRAITVKEPRIGKIRRYFRDEVHCDLFRYKYCFFLSNFCCRERVLVGSNRNMPRKRFSWGLCNSDKQHKDSPHMEGTKHHNGEVFVVDSQMQNRPRSQLNVSKITRFISYVPSPRYVNVSISFELVFHSCV